MKIIFSLISQSWITHQFLKAHIWPVLSQKSLASISLHWSWCRQCSGTLLAHVSSLPADLWCDQQQSLTLWLLSPSPASTSQEILELVTLEKKAKISIRINQQILVKKVKQHWKWWKKNMLHQGCGVILSTGAVKL